MKNKIDAYKNFFDLQTNETIIKLLQRPKWSFTGGGTNGNFKSFFWHMDNLETEDFFQNLFNAIKNKLKLNKKYKLLRCYANGQTAGQSGNEHQDDGDLTILYFPDYWEYQWGGHLLFSNGKELTNIVEYSKNKLIKFNAKQLHFATAPVNIFIGLRTSLAFKIVCYPS